MKTKNILDVYLHGRFAGKLSQEKSGSLSFDYVTDYFADKRPPLSVSMPLAKDTFLDSIARPFFSGLLPDDLVRENLAKFLGVSDKNSFALLDAIGGECAGAVALYHEGRMPPEETATEPEILDEKRLGEILDLLKRRPLLAGENDLRLSLAGAQDKLAVGVIDGKVALLKGSTPTSHILKPLIDRVEDSVHNEFFCLTLAARLGVPAAKADIGFANGVPYLLVERYDRVLDHGKRIRLHQEDFCQALSIPPEKKYEREGGPTVVDCLRLLENHSARPAADKLTFIHLLVFNYLVGNADCHGKNFSLLYGPDGLRLAPAYDLMSTAIYPNIQKKTAMKIGGEYAPELIFRRHWHRLVLDTATARKALDREINEIASVLQAKASELSMELREGGIISAVFDDIGKIIEKRVQQIMIVP